MTDTLNTTQTELLALARRIRDWQTSHNLSDREMERKFSGLGSAKTFSRILADDLSEIDVEKWLLAYRGVCNYIGVLEQETRIDEPTYDDLTPVLALRAAVTDALREHGNNRLVIIEGNPGSGKSTALRELSRKYGQLVITIEANETWVNSAYGFTTALLRALGQRNPLNGATAAMPFLLEKLGERQRILAIDEAHHLGKSNLNLVKTMLNQCPDLVVIFCCLPTLWANLARTAFEECRQLTQNRLSERILLDQVNERDCERLLTRRVEWSDPQSIKKAVNLCQSTASGRGNLNYINLVIRRIRTTCKGAPATFEDATNAVTAVQKTR